MSDLAKRLQEQAQPGCKCCVCEAAAELARLTAELEALRVALLAAKIGHDICEEDCWYSCPASGRCCNDDAGNECNCGADRHNAAIDAAMTKEPPHA